MELLTSSFKQCPVTKFPRINIGCRGFSIRCIESFMKPLFLLQKGWLTVIIFILVAAQPSCSNSPGSHTSILPPPVSAKVVAHKKPPGSFSDTIVIKVPSAVFYSADSLQLEKIRAVTDSSVFESLEHEFFFQVRNSKIVLKQYYPKVNIIVVKNARYLLFKKNSGSTNLIDLDTLNDASGLFAFDGRKDPRLLDMTNIDTELGFYFNK